MSPLSEQDEDYKNFIMDLNSPLRVARSKRYVFMLGSDVRGINLEDYTKSTPPGWQAYMHNYPLKHYRERLALWMRITDVPAEKLGPTILGRIKGSAYRLIMKMRFTQATRRRTWMATMVPHRRFSSCSRRASCYSSC